MIHMTSEAELHRANIRVAWSFADRMTAAQFSKLCRVTAQVWVDERQSVEGRCDGRTDAIERPA